MTLWAMDTRAPAPSTPRPSRPIANALDIVLASFVLLLGFGFGCYVSYVLGVRGLWSLPAVGLAIATSVAAIYDRFAPCRFGYRWLLVSPVTAVLLACFLWFSSAHQYQPDFPPGSLDGYFRP